METKGFSVGEVIRFGWRTMKDNVGFFVVLLLIVGAIEWAPDILATFVAKNASLKIGLQILSVILSLWIGLGLIKVGLKFSNDEKGRAGDFFSCLTLFPKYLFASVLYSLILAAGIILLIVPFFIWGIKYCLYPYFIIDKKMGPIEALKASSKTTMGAKWDLLAFQLVSIVISVLGLLCFFIGLFATVPTLIVAGALVYRKLLAQTETI